MNYFTNAYQSRLIGIKIYSKKSCAMLLHTDRNEFSYPSNCVQKFRPIKECRSPIFDVNEKRILDVGSDSSVTSRNLQSSAL